MTLHDDQNEATHLSSARGRQGGQRPPLTTTQAVLIPRTDNGNDTSDHRQDAAVTAVLKSEVERVYQAQKEATGFAMSQSEIGKRLRYLDLCREWGIRTGKPLIAPDEEVRAKYEHELRLAGVL